MAWRTWRSWLVIIALAGSGLVAVQPAATADPLGGTVAGVVLREDGSPLPAGSRVVAMRLTDGWFRGLASDELDGGGEYRIDDLEPGTYVLRVMGPSIEAGRRGFAGADAAWYSGNAPSVVSAERLSIGSGTTTRHDLRVPPNGTISGRVTDDAGSPVSGVRVGNDLTDDVVVTDDDGRWSLGGFVARSYAVWISDPLRRFDAVRRDVEVELRRETSVDVALRSRPPSWKKHPSFDYSSIPVGGKVTLDLGEYDQPDVELVSVRWKLDNRPITVRGLTYTATASAVDKYLVVTVTIRRRGMTASYTDESTMIRSALYYDGYILGGSGFDEEKQGSGPYREIAPGGAAPAVGEALITSSPHTHPPSEPSARQWLRDGKPITGATSTKYRVVPGDLGHRLTYRVTMTRDGRTVTNKSLTTARVVTRRPSVTFTATPRGAKRVDLGAKIAVHALPATWVDGRLDVYRSRRGNDRLTSVKVRDGRVSTVVLRGQPRGKRTYYVRFRPYLSGVPASAISKRVVRVR